MLAQVKPTLERWSVSKWFHVFWLSMFFLAVGMEVWAIARHGSGFTLSEWVWSKIHSLGMRAAVGALLSWLIWHFIFAGPGRGLGKVDLVFAIVGAFVGIAGTRWGWY